jgi:hypothetical protein
MLTSILILGLKRWILLAISQIRLQKVIPHSLTIKVARAKEIIIPSKYPISSSRRRIKVDKRILKQKSSRKIVYQPR